MEKKLRLALIGYGFLGRWHLEKALSFPEVELTGVVDPSTESRERLNREYPQVKHYASVEQVLSNIDAALVVTPTAYHHEICKKLMENNIHIFCEKPVTSSGNQARELSVILSNHDNLVFQVGHSERMHEVWAKLKSYDLSEVRYVKATRVSPFKARATDVDVVSDLMIHDLDLINYLFNVTCEDVFARGQKLVTGEYDHVEARLVSREGIIFDLDASRVHPKTERSWFVMSKTWNIYIDLIQCKMTVQKNSGELEEISYKRKDHLLEEQKSFFSSILNKSKPIIGLTDGVQAVELGEKIIQTIDDVR